MSRTYRMLSVVAMNAAILFLALNAVAAVWQRFERPPIDPVTAAYGDAAVARAYPDLTRDEIAVLLDETWSRPLTFAPYVHFKEAPYAGTYVNVDVEGFRRVPHQGDWPPNRTCLNVFVFGGSTAFGYGLPDAQTVPAALQDWMSRAQEIDGRRVCIYNFGCASFDPTQERVLFEQLLARGAIPDVAVFLDGLNDGQLSDGRDQAASTIRSADEPEYSDMLKAAFESPSRNDGPYTTRGALATLALRLPLVRALRPASVTATHTVDEIQLPPAHIPEFLNTSGLRYLNNKKLIEAAARAYLTDPIFVWQPAPFYKYDLARHPFPSAPGRNRYVQRRYEWLANHRPQGEEFVWAADLQEGLPQDLYVDSIHYNARMSMLLARSIADSAAVRRSMARWAAMRKDETAVP